LSVVGLLLLAAAAHGQTRYVSDNLVINLRTGPTTRNAITRILSAGEAVQVLEEDQDTGYARVRVLDRGTEGWVRVQYLTEQPIARDRLQAAQRDLNAAQNRAADLEREVAALTRELDETRGTLQQAESASGDAMAELAQIREAAANVLAIREQNESLQQRLAERERQLDSLTIANSELSSRARQNWFVVGAAVLVGGIVIGLIAPSLRRRRRSDW
jgi:SH3 domain protein